LVVTLDGWTIEGVSYSWGNASSLAFTDRVDSDSVYERKDDLTLSFIIRLETARARAFLNGFSIGRLTGTERVSQATIESCLAASGRHERVDEFD